MYLANPLGFSELGRVALDATLLPALGSWGYAVYEPFAGARDLADAMEALAARGPPDAAALAQLREINARVGARNRDWLERCDLVVAVLDDPDPGVAAEIGHASALGKPVFGYYGDFRVRGDNPGAVVNLQVQYFIEASGGVIARSLDALERALATWRARCRSS